MSMTTRGLVLRLVEYCGVTSLDPADPSNNGVLRSGLTAGMVPAAITCINGALQEIHKNSPTAMYYRRVGTFLRAPQGITIDVTQNSQAVTVYGWQDWMLGCSVRMAGDIVVNEFLDQQTLRRPFTSASQAGLTATVYNDTIIVNQVPGGGNVLGIREPVEIPQIRMLVAAGSRKEFYQYEWNPMLGDDYHRAYARFAATPKIPAQPMAYFVDTERALVNSSTGETTEQTQIRLSVLPMPDVLYNLHYGVITDAVSISVADVGSFGPDPWATTGTVFDLPGIWDESVLLPMALKRFSGTPLFGTGNSLIQAEIDRQYKVASSIIQESNPNRAATRIQAVFR